eukprot:scaffold13205_cov113-Skeletonema_dohrnii-CCMP3373.AAC.6
MNEVNAEQSQSGVRPQHLWRRGEIFFIPAFCHNRTDGVVTTLAVPHDVTSVDISLLNFLQ